MGSQNNSKKRAAVVGVGYLGRFHAQKYLALSQNAWQNSLEFVGVFDVNLERGKEVARELNCRHFASPQEMVGQVDLVTIATVTSSHYEMADFFLKNGIHVNVEKPITNRVDQARQLIELARGKNLQLAVGQSERFNPVVQKIKSLLKKPILFEIYRQAPFQGRAGDVSVIHDLTIHDFDMLRFLTGEEWTIQSAVGAKVITQEYDWIQTQLKSTKGLNAHIVSSRAVSIVQRSMRVYCEGQILEGDFQTGQVKVLGRAEAGAGKEPIHTASIDCGKADHLQLETEAFLQSVIHGKNLFITGQDGLKSLELVESAVAKIQASL